MLAVRAIAPLIIVLFLCVAGATALYVNSIYVEVIREAEIELSMMADMTRARMIHNADEADAETPAAIGQSQLIEAMPDTVNRMRAHMLVTNEFGKVQASEPFLPDANGKHVDELLRGVPGRLHRGTLRRFHEPAR